MPRHSSPDDLPLGLRERKKARTRAAIQEHALRLIKAQGYSATTVEQIAAAAEVSPSTFFRYFPTKEDVILWDATDPVMLDTFRAQPPEVSPVEAMRRAMHAVWDRFTDEEAEREAERQRLVLGEPELRLRAVTLFVGAIGFLTGLVAERTGRPADDPDVISFAGAFMGAILGQYLAYEGDDPRELMSRLDKAFDLLERGPGL